MSSFSRAVLVAYVLGDYGKISTYKLVSSRRLHSFQQVPIDQQAQYPHVLEITNKQHPPTWIPVHVASTPVAWSTPEHISKIGKELCNNRHK
jgi:hypothetical protein